MNKEVIVIIFFIAIVILYTLVVYERRKQTQESETVRLNKLISALKDYSRNHPDLAETLKRMGLF